MADEDENKKDWGKEKDSPKKKAPKKSNDKNKQVDDGFVKERRAQQWIQGLHQLFRNGIPIETPINNNETQIQEHILNQFQLNGLRQRFDQIQRQFHRVSLELDKAHLENRRVKSELEGHKATSQLKLERAELETEKVRFQGQKEKAEQLIEILKVKQELQHVKRENQIKCAEIARLQIEMQRLKIQTAKANGQSATTGPAPVAVGGASITCTSSAMQYLTRQQNLLLNRMMPSPHRHGIQRPLRTRLLSAQGEGSCVCGQCMQAEFPNTIEGQRLLEAHLNLEHPQRGTPTGPHVTESGGSCDQLD